MYKNYIFIMYWVLLVEYVWINMNLIIFNLIYNMSMFFVCIICIYDVEY